MRYTLKDYQTEAVRGVLQNLTQARGMYHQYQAQSQFSLAATTGAGKTVMAAAVIEALFFGSDEYDFTPDPGAVVIWFSDDPALNEQSRARVQAAASELDHRLRAVETTFSAPTFEPGYVYFLNTQKLSKGSRLLKGDPGSDYDRPRLFEPRPDEVPTSIHDTISNTINNKVLTLYFVLDEAHRGMSTSDKERTPIVQRLINGQGTVPPMPIVLGISATVDRFTEAMRDVKGRTALPPVEVDGAQVQASGLLKDDIILSIPTEAGTFDTVLLRRAVEKIKSSTGAWRSYADSQGEVEAVLPLLVVQVADKPTTEALTRILDSIYDAWPELHNDAVAHVFGTHQHLTINQRPVPYIEPQRVQDSTRVRILLAMNAVSTGWDCPRAEVLVSFRSAEDPTHITQLLGRMMRTPLARRVPGNEILNAVECILPFFNRKTAVEVAELLMHGKSELGGDPEGRRVLFDPVDLTPNPEIAADVWERLVTLPSATIPRMVTKPIRRLTALAALLSHDGLMHNAVQDAHKQMHSALEGRAIQFKEAVETARQEMLAMQGEEVRYAFTDGPSYKAFSMSADVRAIGDYYRSATRTFSPALCSSYVSYLADADGDEDDLLEAHIKIASLALVPEVAEALNSEADSLARRWLSETRVQRKALPDARRAKYEPLEAMSMEPERIDLVAPRTMQTDTKVREADGREHDLPHLGLHIMADSENLYPVDLNDWEMDVLARESGRSGFLGWYRNPSRGLPESLAVAYRDESGRWSALRPDFVFFTRTADGCVAVDLVDPHSHHLSDALPKLRGLAQFAEAYGDEFHRIESVTKVEGLLRVLDLQKPAVRSALAAGSGARALYESDLADDYL